MASRAINNHLAGMLVQWHMGAISTFIEEPDTQKVLVRIYQKIGD